MHKSILQISFTLFSGLILTTVQATAHTDADISQRIAPVASVCVQGEPCAEAVPL